jgi:hypothetical protein
VSLSGDSSRVSQSAVGPSRGDGRPILRGRHDLDRPATATKPYPPPPGSHDPTTATEPPVTTIRTATKKRRRRRQGQGLRSHATEALDPTAGRASGRPKALSVVPRCPPYCSASTFERVRTSARWNRLKSALPLMRSTAGPEPSSTGRVQRHGLLPFKPLLHFTPRRYPMVTENAALLPAARDNSIGLFTATATRELPHRLPIPAMDNPN